MCAVSVTLVMTPVDVMHTHPLPARLCLKGSLKRIHRLRFDISYVYVRNNKLPVTMDGICTFKLPLNVGLLACDRWSSLGLYETNNFMWRRLFNYNIALRRTACKSSVKALQRQLSWVAEWFSKIERLWNLDIKLYMKVIFDNFLPRKKLIPGWSCQQSYAYLKD